MTEPTPTSDPFNVTVLGLGAMGSGIARNLASAGHRVTVWNRTRDRAATLADLDLAVAPTPAAAVANADVVIAMVRDDEASHAVWLGPDGAAAALPATAIAVEGSTITPAWAVELAHAIRDLDRSLLEAPVIGSRPQLAARSLVSLVGGGADLLDRVRPVLTTYSGVVRHCGDVGAAAVTKLAVNGLFAAQVAAFAETVGFLQRNGVPVDATTEFLSNLPITSPGLQRILGLFAAADYAPNFPIELVAKDLDYLVAAAAVVGAELPVAAATAATFAAADASGHGALDIAGIGARYGIGGPDA